MKEQEETNIKDNENPELEEKVNVKGIIQKKLKILVIDGILPGIGGVNWIVAKALIQNGTGKDVEFNGAWTTKVDIQDLGSKYLIEKGVWRSSPLCYAENADSASSVRCLGPNQAVDIETYSAGADVVVVVNSDSLQENVLKGKKFQDMIQYKKVISYGNSNQKLDAGYFDKEGYKSKYVHLDSEEGCENLLDFIQNSVDLNDKEKFILPKKVKIKKNDGEGILHKIKKYAKENKKETDGEGILHKMKKYAKKNKKKTAAGGIAGLVTFGEEFVGQLLFRKSILGAIFGYNSNSKEKSVKDVKDNKDAKKGKNKEVNNSGNQVK